MSKEKCTIYVRVSADIKAEVNDYAENNGMFLTAAIERLLKDGLKYRAEIDGLINEAVATLSAGASNG
jgi:hypothetical protein